jgi:hypothetical protein
MAPRHKTQGAGGNNEYEEEWRHQDTHRQAQ